MGTSNHRCGRGTAGSTDIISWSSSFCSLLELNSSSPSLMTLMVFEASWNCAICPLGRSLWALYPLTCSSCHCWDCGMSSGGCSNRLPHDWHLDAMGISSARAFRIAPASLSSCLAEVDPQPRRGRLACAFEMNPSSPAGSSRYGCQLCTSGCCRCTSGNHSRIFSSCLDQLCIMS
jgi:hypothetical protein